MSNELVVNRGRPSKYKPEFCQMLIDFMAQGYSFKAFAGHVGVSESSVHSWKEKYPEFGEAYKLAFAKSRTFWETTYLNGLFEDVSSSKKVNTTLLVFAMKTKFQWTDRIEHNVHGNIDIQIDYNVLNHFDSEY